MSVTPVNSGSSQAAVANTVNSLAKELESTKSVQVFKDDTGTRRVILDKDGLRTSEAGVDVYSATNDQLTFNSNYNLPKIVASGTASVTAATGTSVVTAVDISSLNLSSAPMILAMAKSPSSPNTFYQMPHIQDPNSATLLIAATAWVNFSSGGSQEIRFQVQLGSSAAGAVGEWAFRYYVFFETAES